MILPFKMKLPNLPTLIVVLGALLSGATSCSSSADAQRKTNHFQPDGGDPKDGSIGDGSWPDANVDSGSDGKAAAWSILADEAKAPPWRWDEMAKRVINSSLLPARFAQVGYQPPLGTDIHAAAISKNNLGLAYAYFESGGGAFKQSFWPASTIKLLTSLAALDFIKSQGFSGAAKVQWASGFGDVVNNIVDRAIRVSSNQDYDRTIRIAGFDRLNSHWLSKKRGFPTTVIKASYAGFEVKNPPGYTLSEGSKIKTIPARTAKGSYPCASSKNNCTNLFELTDAVRRVVLDSEIEAQDRFDLAATDKAVLKKALCSATPSFFAKGVTKTLGSGATICHKPGWVPGLDSLDHGIITSAKGQRFLLGAAIPDPGDSSSQGKLAILAEQTLSALTKQTPKPFALQRSAGQELRVAQNATGLRFQALGADEMRFFVDGQEILASSAAGDGLFQATISKNQWQGRLLTLRAFRLGKLVSVRNFVVD